MANVLRVDATSGGVDAFAEKSIPWADDLFIQFDIQWPTASQTDWIIDGFFPYFYHQRQNTTFGGGDHGSDVYLDFNSYPAFEWDADGSTVTTSHVEPDTWHTVKIEITDGSFINSGSVGVDGDTPTADLIGLGAQDSIGWNAVTTGFGTTTVQKVASQFVATGGPLRLIKLSGTGPVGTVSDNVTVDICSDASGSPGTSLGQITVTGSAFTTANRFDFSSLAITLTASTSYWVVIGRSGAPDNTNHYTIGTSASAVNAGTYNGSTWSVSSGGGYATDIYYSNDVILRFGNYYSDPVAAVTYFRNFKVGTSLGAVDLWDGTAITSLSDFDTDSGDATVIADPTGPGPTVTVEPGKYIYKWTIKHFNHDGTIPISADYSGYSYDETSNEIFHATGRNMNFYLNGVDDAGFTLYLDDPMAEFIIPTKSTIKIYRTVYAADGVTVVYEDESTLPSFAGTVGSTLKDGDANTMTVKAFSPLWRLQSRFHVHNHYLVIDADTTEPYTGSGLIFKLIDLLNNAFPLTGDQYTGIEIGTAHWVGEPEMSPYFVAKGSNTWALIYDDIMSRPAAADIVPIYNDDTTNIMMFLDTKEKRGSNISADIAFNYHTGANDNCENITEELAANPGDFANFVWVIGQGGANSGKVAVAWDNSSGNFDSDSIGLYMKTVDKSEVKRLKALAPLASAELKQSRWPKMSYEVTLSPYGGLIYNYNYSLGDVVKINAQKGALAIAKNQRIYQVGLNISDNNVEVATPLVSSDFYGKLAPSDGSDGGSEPPVIDSPSTLQASFTYA